MEPIVCLDCGFIVGAYYEAFLMMKEVYLGDKNREIHFENKSIFSEVNDNLEKIFDILEIKNYCCRSQLLTCRSISSIIF